MTVVVWAAQLILRLTGNLPDLYEYILDGVCILLIFVLTYTKIKG